MNSANQGFRRSGSIELHLLTVELYATTRRSTSWEPDFVFTDARDCHGARERRRVDGGGLRKRRRRLLSKHSDFLAKLEDLTSSPQARPPRGMPEPDILVRLTRAPVVSIALIRGAGEPENGSELALACDMSFASREKALLSQWEVGVGLFAGGGPMARCAATRDGTRPRIAPERRRHPGRRCRAPRLTSNRVATGCLAGQFVDALATRIASFDRVGDRQHTNTPRE